MWTHFTVEIEMRSYVRDTRSRRLLPHRQARGLIARVTASNRRERVIQFVVGVIPPRPVPKKSLRIRLFRNNVHTHVSLMRKTARSSAVCLR